MRHRLHTDLNGYQAFAVDQADQRTNRKRSAAESEHVDLVARFPVPTDETVELSHVRGDPDAGSAVQKCERFEARRTHSLYVVGNLVGERLVQRSVEPPDVRLLCRKGVSRPVRKDNYFLGHQTLSKCAIKIKLSPLNSPALIP